MKNVILIGDVLEKLKDIPDESVQMCVTSPPYFSLRDYQVEGQIGLEKTFEEYIEKLLAVTAELKRVLKPSGTLWWNHGDSYGTGSGSGIRNGKQATNFGTQSNKNWQENGKPAVDGYEKSLLLQAYRLAIRMVDEQKWKLRNTVIWHKTNSMPTSVLDRLGNKYEPVFFFSKSKKYYFDLDSIRIPYESDEPRNFGVVRARENGYNTKLGTKRREEEEEAKKFGKRRPPQPNNEYARNPKGKNPGDVWSLTLQPHKERHIAMFPEKLIEPMIKAGCPVGGIVLDPFGGAMTTCVVAKRLRRDYIAIELNPDYAKMGQERIDNEPIPMF